MAEDVIAAVSEELLEAEKLYDSRYFELDGFGKVLSILMKLGRVREAKVEQGEDVSAMDDLLKECHSKLSDIISEDRDAHQPFGVNFQEWGGDIEKDLRAQDPLMLSFDSGSDDDADKPKLSAKLSSRTDASFSSRGASSVWRILTPSGQLRSKHADAAEGGFKDDRFFCVSTLAWVFAVIGMMITIGFLAGDFWKAQRDVAIQIERSQPAPLELPAITICHDAPNVPTFASFPTAEFPGLPIFAVATYVSSNRTGVTRDMLRVYPDTLPGTPESPVEYVVVSEDKAALNRTKTGFDVKREMRALHAVRSAGSYEGLAISQDYSLQCLRIGYKKREMLYPFPNTSNAYLSPAVQLRVFKSRLFGACQSNVLQRDKAVDELFASELELFAKELEERGVLDFSGEKYSVLKETQMEIGGPYYIDFYCNVYFFSGFFYPTVDNADISYKYNKSSRARWERSGKGPYYSAYSWEAGAPPVHGPNLALLEKDTYALRALRVFAEEAASVNNSESVSPKTGISVIDARKGSLIRFRRVNVGGKNGYRVRAAVSQDTMISWEIVDTYELGFDFETFETEKILTSPTMSWPEFLTDVFEFVGLFTGICIFTLIVAPAHQLV